jgi:hypothetical protein
VTWKIVNTCHIITTKVLKAGNAEERGNRCVHHHSTDRNSASKQATILEENAIYNTLCQNGSMSNTLNKKIRTICDRKITLGDRGNIISSLLRHLILEKWQRKAIISWEILSLGFAENVGCISYRTPLLHHRRENRDGP